MSQTNLSKAFIPKLVNSSTVRLTALVAIQLLIIVVLLQLATMVKTGKNSFFNGSTQTIVAKPRTMDGTNASYMDYTNSSHLDDTNASIDDPFTSNGGSETSTLQSFHNAPSGIDLHPSIEKIRFVLFLCAPVHYFSGAMALLASLADSARSTLLPPLVIVVGNSTIVPEQQMLLESLGAQVTFVEMPKELVDVLNEKGSIFHGRWQSVFAKILLFLREIVQCDLIFYIDLDAVVRGNLIECMSGLLELFRSNPELEILATGSRSYFNNGVMIARPNDSTFFYLVDMLRNGTCTHNCTERDYMTQMRRSVATDQDVFIEYTKRFPSRFQPVNFSNFNLRPMHQKTDTFDNCSIVHFVGEPKPWDAWLIQDNETLHLLPQGLPTRTQQAMKSKGNQWTQPLWALQLWRDKWNEAITRWWEYSGEI